MAEWGLASLGSVRVANGGVGAGLALLVRVANGGVGVGLAQLR